MDSHTDFFVLETDLTGEIREIIHASAVFSRLLSATRNIISIMDEGSREKISRLLSIIKKEESYLASWELFLAPSGQPGRVEAVYLGGLRDGGRAILFGGSALDSVRKARNWLLKNPGTLSAEILKTLSRVPADSEKPPDDSQTFNEITRLYSELSAAQRELGKKNVQLEQLNATISRYASSLEEMVEERTRQLRESEARFRGIFEFSSLGIAILDDQGNIYSANQSLLSILARVFPGQEISNITGVFYRGRDYKSIHSRLSCGKISKYQFEVELDCEDGGKCWLEINYFLVPLEDTRQSIAINLFEDITSRKENERALILAEKLTVVGKIAASLAHEINNPLQAILGNLDLAGESLDSNESAQRYLRIARDELRRVSRIVSDLRGAIRKPSRSRKTLTPVDEVVEKIAGLVRKKCVEKGIALSIESVKPVPQVLMDRGQIEQVLLNLVINAIEAVSGGGKISISSRLCESPAGIEILVCNTGKPIPKTAKKRIFGPFFTTKEDGLGLGLHISREIMEAHEGKIELLDRQDQTCFRMFLPNPAK